jgi:hypothetical protein
VHLLCTSNELAPPLIDGPPPFFNHEAESVGTDDSNGSNVYGYDDDMAALMSDIDGDEDNILDETDSVGTDNSYGPDVCAYINDMPALTSDNDSDEDNNDSDEDNF